jgi:leucyl aminopeptidase (aminopeptidase T)
MKWRIDTMKEIRDYKEITELFENKKQEVSSMLKAYRGSETEESAYFKFCLEWAEKLLVLEKDLTADYFERTDIETLKKQNYALYVDVLPMAYETSYANPVYMSQLFGRELGQELSYLNVQLRRLIHFAYSHQQAPMLVCVDFLLEAFDLHKNNTLTLEGMKKLTEVYNEQMMDFNSQVALNQAFNKSFDFYTQIIEESNLEDVRYLFKFGSYITDNELETANFLNKYKKETLNTLAKAIADAYVEGFRREGKDISLRHNVKLAVNIGQEQITKLIFGHLKTHDLEGFVYEVISTEVNKQYSYDHKFDNGLYMTEEWAEKKLASLKETALGAKDVLSDYSGILYVERFGEEPFSPISNDDRVKLSEGQQVIYQKLQNEQRQLMETYIPEQERSFCIVAFPTPEIGEDFEAIFEDTLKINMLDSNFYEEIQGKIIDALDKGNCVRVKGKGPNLTDISVALMPLNNPAKETNFVNCVADVNIPVGEVFTSPVLKGTSGLLHIENVYLEGFNFENLKLWFKDGYIDEYSCTNFEDMNKGKEFIKENLLFPHKTLPIGEFAIGTNTLAYVIAEKYGIVDKLPILIVEKMGPHFAIGDTCFSWSEDTPVYNQLDGKEIIARDNEHSIKRKVSISEAYTNCHTDITIPYDALEEISVKTADKDIVIIENGRFVLEGTEALNKPFKE